MFEYIYINKTKLARVSLYCGIGFTLFLGILFIIVPARPGITLTYKFLIFFGTSAIMTCVALGLNMLAGFYHFIKKRKAFKHLIWQDFFVKNNFGKL